MQKQFRLEHECIVHENYKELVLKAKDIDSVVTSRTTGHPVRTLRNAMTREYLKMEKEGKPFEELEKLTLGSLRRAVFEGDRTTGSFMAGQIAGLVSKEQSAKEIIEEILKEAEEVITDRLKKFN